MTAADVIAIGVTGHRFLAEIDRLQAAVDRALAAIDRRFPSQDWTVLSSLAEGADRLVVERALAYHPSTKLVAVLPLSVQEYQTDFSSEESRQEFQRLYTLADEIFELPASNSRKAAYRSSGKTIVQRADILIALWDGLEAQGAGGTGEMVAAARQAGLPIAWVHAGNRIPGSQAATTLGADQGRLTLEGF